MPVRTFFANSSSSSSSHGHIITLGACKHSSSPRKRERESGVKAEAAPDFEITFFRLGLLGCQQLIEASLLKGE